MKLNEVLQWAGAVAIIAGHVLNSALEYGYNVRPYNIVAFAVGTVLFLTWAYRVRNMPQAVVNIVALAVGLAGLFRAWA